MKALDLAGQKFGRLTALSVDHVRSKKRYWLFECECGNRHVAEQSGVVHGKTKSCGCLRTQSRYDRAFNMPKGESGLKRALASYKYGAKKRGFAWRLSKKQFHEIAQQNCTYCGIPPSAVFKAATQHGDYTYNGIDRINNDKSYVPGNVTACCTFCNMAKGTMSSSEYLSHIERVAAFQATRSNK